MDLRETEPELSDHPVDVGHRTEAIVVAYLVRRGHRVLIPYGTNQRYDLVLDLDGEFVRVQCKTGRLRRGVVEFTPISTRSNTRTTIRQNYAGQIEFFLVYCPETGHIYAVPVEEVPATNCYLRVDPTRNGQEHGIRWAHDYELPG